MDRLSKQKINEETQVLNDTLDEMDLIAICRTLHPNAEEYTFFSSAHGTFSTCWVTNQTSRNLRKLKSYQASFSNTTLRDQISNTRKKTVKNTNTWRLNNTFLNQQVTEEIKREIKKFLEKNDNGNKKTENLWDAEKQF